jgi:hypothetical protein
LFFFYLCFVLFEKSRLLVSWCADGRCGMRATTRTMAGVEDLVQRTENDRTDRVLSDRVIEMSGGAVCGLHLARGD